MAQHGRLQHLAGIGKVEARGQTRSGRSRPAKTMTASRSASRHAAAGRCPAGHCPADQAGWRPGPGRTAAEADHDPSSTDRAPWSAQGCGPRTMSISASSGTCVSSLVWTQGSIQGCVAAQVGQAWQEPARRKCGRHHDDDRSRLGIGVQAADAMAQFFQCGLRGDQKIAPGIDQFDPPPDPAKQRLAKVIFQHADLMADGRLGDVQLFGRAGKTLQPGGGLKADQGGKRGKAAIGAHE